MFLSPGRQGRGWRPHTHSQNNSHLPSFCYSTSNGRQRRRKRRQRCHRRGRDSGKQSSDVTQHRLGYNPTTETTAVSFNISHTAVHMGLFESHVSSSEIKVIGTQVWELCIPLCLGTAHIWRNGSILFTEAPYLSAQVSL